MGVRRLGFRSWTSVPVQHCRDAWGLVIQHESGWKLTYSGDTRPNRSLVAAGMDSDLVIHESTFEGDLRSHAVAKRHSTSEEALAVAKAMRAKRILLTHFSQRYPKIPKTLTEGVPSSPDALSAVSYIAGSQRNMNRREEAPFHDDSSRAISQPGKSLSTTPTWPAAAFDGMAISFALLKELPLVMPALVAAMGEEEDVEVGGDAMKEEQGVEE
eukprot:CAMPEP_0175074092 /NCGR_PEP_ID=MMETSP0052_2-20121109/21058_1 /TAXON_ID=51329 ORGANISM="Polytomella parva, Strain SAG 63-3" /NCGR_SAMPLE_ID=MMETSP0052_2 /ASSEMBLY_ACC=CAM_ASM_000194 /LENGTH=213 /DNA_ID=CAMNT_0016342239 /DNA_START=92 /DNA_END=733 /DNA_ORIENTATION=-